jgi:hypothetical protein
MISLESLVSDATIWSITLELSSTILEASFDDSKMFTGSFNLILYWVKARACRVVHAGTNDHKLFGPSFQL